MKISTPTRVAPDSTHARDRALFGGEDGFELSTIRPEDASIAIEMLIGNYAAPIDAVIRELYVNADDSHRASGQTKPVELTMPTEQSPFFVVRDYGLGMSSADMVDIYTRPAASTKRAENISTGGLGIGAKSPFTVADRFVVRGIKDGRAATLIMARIDGHLMHLVDDERPAPSEPNSVEVTVPVEVDKIEQWWKALSRVHFWWDDARAIITNADASPVALPTWSNRILDGEAAPTGPAIVHSQNLRTPVILMGQIAYSIPEGVLDWPKSLVYVLPVGAVTIAPTRESIVATDENREVLTQLLRAWEDDQFEGLAQKILNPGTSILGLADILGELHHRLLTDHFSWWLHRKYQDEIASGLLPQYVSHMISWLVDVHTIDRTMPETRLHGRVDNRGSRSRTLFETISVTLHNDQPTVYVDSRTLPESRRRILTKWAAEQDVIAVLVDREQIEAIRFSPEYRSIRQPDSLTRPFAYPDEIKWVDPADVHVVRAPRKNPAPAPMRSSSIEVLDMAGHRRKKRLTTVDELVTHTKKRPNRWVIVDTVSEIAKIEVRLPKNIVAVASGQRPAALLRKMLKTRALTVTDFKAKQADYVLRSLTKTQQCQIADLALSRLERVSHFFTTETAWIAQIADPKVRAVAEEISGIVKKSAEAYLPTAPRTALENSATDYISAIKTQIADPSWLIEHASLGKFAPALIAAQSSGLSSRWRGSDELIIEHIRQTIATQLVEN